jgi:ribosomal protein L11 methylase PrmA
MLALYVIGNGVAIVQFTVIDYGCHAGILSVRVAKIISSVINKS